MQKRICKCGKIFNDPCSIFESSEPVPGTCISCAIKAENAWLKELDEKSKREPRLDQVDQDALFNTPMK